jgi:hypothetical protein
LWCSTLTGISAYGTLGPVIRSSNRAAQSAHLVGAAALGVAAVTLSSNQAFAAVPKLLVYLHLNVKQQALQSALQAMLPGVVITAVGRIADFDRALADGRDAVLSLPIVLSARRLVPVLHGERQGALDEDYALVGTETNLDVTRVKSVGAVDILGREGTTSFVHALIGAQPRVERVTKLEDLLPLLQMQRVDGIVLPARLVPDLKTASRLNLVELRLTTRVGLPAVAAASSNAEVALGAIRRLPRVACQQLGVDRWR